MELKQYIGREALLAAYDREHEGEPGRARKLIVNAPAEDVLPVRHGRWIETTQPMGWDEVTCAECSECGEDFVLDEWGMEDMKNLMHYCPNCGAKMDEEEE